MARTYYASILDMWRWADIRLALDAAIEKLRNTQANMVPDDGVDATLFGITANAIVTDDGDIQSSVYIGRSYRESPSGSFYAPWSAIPDSVRDKDQRWYTALERAANKFGMEIMSGEGDPTDTYVYDIVPIEDPAELALMPDDIGAK